MRDRRRWIAGGFAGAVAIRQADQVRRVLAGDQPIDQRLEDHLAVAADHVVDITRAETDVVVLRREIAAPDDFQAGVARLELAAEGYGIGQLRAGHDRDAEHGRAALTNEPVECIEWSMLEVAVHDEVLVLALEQCAQRQQREGHDRFAAGRAGRVVQDQHCVGVT